METRNTVLIWWSVTCLLVLCVPKGQSQSFAAIDTILAVESILTLKRPVLHSSLISIRDLNGQFLRDSTDYRIIDSLQIRLMSDALYDRYYIVRERPLSPILANPATWIDTQLVKSDYLIKSLPLGLESESSFPAWSSITYSGHFGRGVNIGNNQNTTLNSNFDLQLRGSLPHGIEVVGSLSDNSIPIQPEGNSQRLQEFDKVFIQLKKDNATLIAGDHEIRSPDNYFMRYYKKTKGVFASYQSDMESGWSQRSSINYSVSKGKFKRTPLSVEEGNQGPYRVAESGNNLFVVILAGTERVYLDGQLLKRGELNDYTIDYNLGEITFTPRIYISATSRIIVEYEFAEQNYLRSLIAGHSTWQKNNWEMGLQLYSEQDGKSAYQNNILTPENEAILAEAGDNVEELTGTSVVPWQGGYEEGVVLYEVIDTLGYSGILRHVKEPIDAPLYTASFSFVGSGNGDYEQASTFTNGEVFHWVPPNPDGSHNGSYAPITRLQAPQQQQMFGFNIKKSWGGNLQNSIYSEWSLTNEDLNRFSNTDQEDNAGWAQNSGFTWGLDLDTTREQSFRINGNLEWRKSTFRPIASYRPVEFDRNWNYQTDAAPVTERFYQLGARYQDRNFNTAYGYQSFDAFTEYTGNRHEFDLHWTPGKWDIQLFESLTHSKTTQVASTFSRPTATLRWKPGESGDLTFSTGYQGEFNEVRDRLSDSLTAVSMKWDKGFVRMDLKNNHSFTLSSRLDYQPGTNQFLRAFRTDDLQMETGITGEKSYIRWIATVRHLNVIRQADIIRDDQQGWNILGQMLFSQRWFDDGWNNQGEIALSNGKEPRRQFQYIKVETGNGQYKYVDVNQDSIQQLNEFFPAIYPDERNYIRVSSLENTLISTFNYNLKWAWNIDLAKWTDHKFWSRWSTENSFHIENKQQRTGKIRLWNIPDTSLVSSRQNVLSNLYFNRNGKIFQEHLGYWVRKQKDFLHTGFETFDTREFFTKSTIIYSGQVNSLLDLKWRLVDQSATAFVERNFSLQFLEASHKLRWMLNQTMQLEYETGLIRGSDEDRDHTSSIWNNQLSWQFRPNLKWSTRTSVDYSNVRFKSAEQNLSLEQVMLGGLRPGNNLLWETNVQRRLPNNLVISLRYHGRKNGDASVVHSGSIQANLLF